MLQALCIGRILSPVRLPVSPPGRAGKVLRPIYHLTYAQDLALSEVVSERWPSSFLLVRVRDVDCVSSALDSYAPLAVVGCKCL